MSYPIENLRIYRLARELEDKVYRRIQKLPNQETFGLSDQLRRSTSSVAHYIAEAHRLYDYKEKIVCLHRGKGCAEEAITFLQQFETAGYGKTPELQEEYTSLIKQSWGLIKYLRSKDEIETSQAPSTMASATAN